MFKPAQETAFQRNIRTCLTNPTQALDVYAHPLDALRSLEMLQVGAILPERFLFQNDVVTVLAAIQNGPLEGTTREQSPAFLCLKMHCNATELHLPQNTNQFLIINYLQAALHPLVSLSARGYSRVITRPDSNNPGHYMWYMRLNASKEIIANVMRDAGRELPEQSTNRSEVHFMRT